MTTLTETAAQTFNRVMVNHSCDLRASPADFSIGDQFVMPALNQRGEDFANNLFDLIFPRLSSGIYYHYLTFEAFEKVVEHECLRFFSTKKLTSEGEFNPLCKDLGLDGYWRLDEDGKEAGEHTNLMDDLFYKSFVDCPDTNAARLWTTFAGGGTGVRIEVEITVNPAYPDFRRVSYQGSHSVSILKDLLDAFRSLDRHFIPFGISRMPAYHQIKDYAYQNECRLIAKRHPGAHDCFPFRVGRDGNQQCNYIDCSLDSPTCSAFQLKMVGFEGGPSCDKERLLETLSRLPETIRDRMEACLLGLNRQIAKEVLKTTPGLAQELIELWMSGEPDYENGLMGLPTDEELEDMFLRRFKQHGKTDQQQERKS